MATRKVPATKASTEASGKSLKSTKKEEAEIPVIDPEESLARLCAEGALDKKAENVVILDMRGISSFTDFFVIASGTSEPQLKAIAGSIREKVREATGLRPTAEDGFPVSQWVIIDYGSVIVHIFHAEKREIYALESLWNDARRIEVAV